MAAVPGHRIPAQDGGRHSGRSLLQGLHRGGQSLPAGIRQGVCLGHDQGPHHGDAAQLLLPAGLCAGERGCDPSALSEAVWPVGSRLAGLAPAAGEPRLCGLHDQRRKKRRGRGRMHHGLPALHAELRLDLPENAGPLPCRAGNPLRPAGAGLRRSRLCGRLPRLGRLCGKGVHRPVAGARRPLPRHLPRLLGA